MEATSIEPMVWTYNGHSVFFDPLTDMGCLTSMWEACGRPKGKEPWEWLRLPQAQDFIFDMCEDENLEKSQVLITQQGRNGGTWAHWQVATIYAHYLNPKFYRWWNRQARAHIEGEFVLTPAKFDAILTEMAIHFRAQEDWSGKAADILFQVRELLRQEPALFGKEPLIEPTIKDTPVLDPKQAGKVYVFQVENKPGQYKIGMTQSSVEDRARDGPGQTDDIYVQIKVIETNNADMLEKKIQRFYRSRVGKHIKKELFRLDDLDLELLLMLKDYEDADRFRADERLTKFEQDDLFNLN